jgi:hypothetical protein
MVFFIKFLELSLFPVSELLHFIDFRKKFIKIQKSVLFKSFDYPAEVVPSYKFDLIRFFHQELLSYNLHW